MASGATLNLATFSETVGSIAGAGNIALGTGTLTSGGNNASTTFSGVISGTGGMIKAGTGSLTLSGTNTYSGVTTVSAGTLVAANTSALGATSSGTTVTAGATLNVDNVALAAEPLTLNGAGVGGAGALTGTGTASVSGGVTMAGAGTIGTTSAASSLTLGGVVTAPYYADDRRLRQPHCRQRGKQLQIRRDVPAPATSRCATQTTSRSMHRP